MKSIADLNINIDYTFSSGLGALEESRYIKEAQALIYNGDCADNKENECIGNIEFKLLYLEQAEEDGFDIYAIFDTYEYTFRHAQSFYDFESCDFKSSIRKHYRDILFNGNLCIIETMTLLPAYRGYQIGSRLFKDIVFHFKNFSSLFILQPYPLQFDHRYREGEVSNKMELEKFKKNKAEATRQLTSYYQSWGFEKIKGVKDLLFYNAEVANDKFELISLDE